LRLPKRKILDYYCAGADEKMWYEETYKTVKQLFPRRDISIVLSLLAATSANTSLKGNVSQFFKALFQYENGLPFEGFTPAVITQLCLIRQGSPINGRKLRNFAEAMIGNPEAIVVDIWIMRACRLKAGSREVPTKKQYDHVEKMFRKYAKEVGVEPRQFCAAVWAGVRRSQTKRSEVVRYCDVLRSKIRPCFFTETEILTKKGIYRNFENYFAPLVKVHYHDSSNLN
jgi:hypothetical protein